MLKTVPQKESFTVVAKSKYKSRYIYGGWFLADGYGKEVQTQGGLGGCFFGENRELCAPTLTVSLHVRVLGLLSFSRVLTLG